MYVYNEELTNYLNDQEQIYENLHLSLDDILVTKRYEPNGYTYQQKIPNQVINMYDYFQHAVDIPVKDLHIRLSNVFDLSQVTIIGISNNQSEVYFNGKKIAIVNIAPLTNQLIGSIMWLNSNEELIYTDIYDRRGFKSSSQYYHLDGSIANQIFYDINGNQVLEIITNHQNITYKLLNYQGNDYLIQNETELWNFFKSELSQETTS